MILGNDFNSSGNINYIEEYNFNILPDDAIIWRGELPFKPGDTFPTDEIKKRASRYKTNTKLYNNELDDVYNTVFSWTDLMSDMVTKRPVQRIVPGLPSFKICTDMWVNLLLATPPKIDGVKKELDSLSSVLENSNFLDALRTAIKHSLFMYGNAVLRVDKLAGGDVKIINMPIKTWIAFVNENDFSSIDVNCFFNIFTRKDDSQVCEFILYHEDGTIIKQQFNYYNGKLGELIKEEKTVSSFGLSPIIVFSGNMTTDSIYGTDLYKYWDASIASCIRAYETLLVLSERSKEITRVLPAGATNTDENSGITYMPNSYAITYTDIEHPPKVEDIVPSVDLTSAIEVYKNCLIRLSTDTNLSYVMFDSSVLGSNRSAKALRTSLYPTQLEGEGKLANILLPTKLLIIKIAKLFNLDISLNDFTVNYKLNIVEDKEEQMRIIQARVGNEPTMTVSDAIVAYDNSSRAVAENTSLELQGKRPKLLNMDITGTTSGDESEVSQGVGFTLEQGNEIEEHKKPTNTASFLGPFGNIGGAK